MDLERVIPPRLDTSKPLGQALISMFKAVEAELAGYKPGP